MTQAAPPIDPRFRSCFEQHQGMRVLGYPLTGLVEVEGYPAQLYSILAYMLASGASAAVERLGLVSLDGWQKPAQRVSARDPFRNGSRRATADW